MEEDRREEGTSSRGTDWEVVSLTASAYAAAPGPKGFVPSDEAKDGSFGGKEVSSGFVPSDEAKDGSFDGKEVPSAFVPSDEAKDGSFDGKEVPSGFVPSDEAKDGSFDGKVVSSGFVPSDEAKDGSFDGKEVSSDAMMKSGHFVIAESEGENVMVREIVSELGGQEVGDRAGEDNQVDLNRESDDPTEFFDKGKSVADDDGDSGEGEKLQELASAEEEKDDGAGHPCGDWWKKQAFSLYSHVKEVNKFWSVVVAAAVVGLVIWGQRWRKDKVQLQQLKWQPSINKERMNQMEGPIHRVKGVLAGSNQRSPCIGAHTSN